MRVNIRTDERVLECSVSLDARPIDDHGMAIARQEATSADEALGLANVFGVFGDALRLRVLTGLAGADELCVRDLALAFGVSDDAVSYALRRLRAVGLVSSRKDGRLRFYRLTDGTGQAVRAAVGALAPLLHQTALGGTR